MPDIKFELNRLTDYSDEEIIKEIRRVAAKLNVTQLTRSVFNKESKVASSTVGRRFGGWKQALEAAGLGHLYSGIPVTKKMQDQKNRNITNEQLLDELRRVSIVVGRKDISSGDIAKHSDVGRDVFSLRFGSLENARQLAGLECRAAGAARLIHTHENLFTNLYDVWVHYGRQPHHSEMNEPPSQIKAKNYTNRFGTWRKALLAFIDYMQKDSEEVATDVKPEPRVSAHAGNQIRSTVKKGPGNRREISLGLRFTVLTRDNFKCVLCGNNPPAKPGLVLHVDHILPWSKGGKTELDNLRSLCEACNLGRGNRYSQ